MSVLIVSLTSHSLVPLPQPHYSLRHNIEIWSINNSAVASKCSSERKSHMSLTLNHKLDMIKLSEESMLKAGKKTRLLVPFSYFVNAKEKFLKEIISTTPVNTCVIKKKKVKQHYC